MDSSFEFNAPQNARNLAEMMDDVDDHFFDAVDEVTKLSSCRSANHSAKYVNNCAPEGISNVSSGNEDNEQEGKEEDRLSESLSNIKLKTFEGIHLLPTPRDKPHNMVTRQDIKEASPHLSLEMRNRSILRVSPSKVATKRKAQSFGEQIHRVPIKMYRTLAENIYHFERDTPPRFRTQKQGVQPSLAPSCSKPTATVPITPQLLSRDRIRLCHVPSHEEREITFMEELKKNPVKPVPLNKRIFDPPQLPDHPKQFTVPEPFNITDLQKPKEKLGQRKSVFEFKGNDRPKLKAVRPSGSKTHLLNNPKFRHQNSSEQLDGKKVDLTGVIGLREGEIKKKTIVQPFSFYERDLELAKRKEQKLKKLIEEENKYKEFHAKPVPSFISNDSANVSMASSTRSKYHHHECEKILPFKAKSPSVLYKEPFRVKKHERLPLEPLNLELNTEKRAVERKIFDQGRKEREEEIMKAIKAFKEQTDEENEQLLAEVRKATVHKPLPVPPCVTRKWRRRSRSLS